MSYKINTYCFQWVLFCINPVIHPVMRSVLTTICVLKKLRVDNNFKPCILKHKNTQEQHIHVLIHVLKKLRVDTYLKPCIMQIMETRKAQTAWQGFKYIYNETALCYCFNIQCWQGLKYMYNVKHGNTELCFNIPVKTSQTIRLDAVHLIRLLSQDETAPLWVIGKTS